MIQTRDVAEALHNYMRFRAGLENLRYELDRAFYRGWIDRGVRSFFGVQIDGTDIVADEQNPEALAARKSRS